MGMAPASAEVTFVFDGTWFAGRESRQVPMGLSSPVRQPTSVGYLVGVSGCEGLLAEPQGIRGSLISTGLERELDWLVVCTVQVPCRRSRHLFLCE